MFNLEPPPGFRGLHPGLPVQKYVRNLPHWRQEGATYFVTFSLADALPQAKQNELRSLRRDWELRHPKPRTEAAWIDYARQFFRKADKWLDQGYGECWFNKECYAKELERALLHYDGERYELGCATVMANHCHLVIRPYADRKIENEIGAMKSVVSHFIQQHESRTGPLWQQEAYDRIVRDAEHLYRVVQYVGRNPRVAGLARCQWRRWINPRWKKVGWDFEPQ